MQLIIEEIPGVNTQGENLEEAKKNLKEALSLVLGTNKIPAQKQFDKNFKQILQ